MLPSRQRGLVLALHIHLILQYSAALIGVAAASCACESSLCQYGPCFYFVFLRHTHPCNRETSTRNPLCHFFSSQSVLVSTIGIGHDSCPLRFRWRSLQLLYSWMVIFQVRPVIATRKAWIAILLIRTFGFIAQVCSSGPLSLIV